MPKLLYQGHGSFRLTAGDGRVIYVDPFKGRGYDAPADVILVTHRHMDHSKVKRCAQKPGCRAVKIVEKSVRFFRSNNPRQNADYSSTKITAVIFVTNSRVKL